MLGLRNDMLKNHWIGRKMTGIRKSEVSFGNMRKISTLLLIIPHSKCLFQDAKDTGEESSKKFPVVWNLADASVIIAML